MHKELLKEAERLDIKDKSTLILSELLFTENILEEVKKYRLLMLRFCNENRKAQKYLLGGFEKLVGDVYKDKLFKDSVKILKSFYDLDIIDEEVIFEWSAKESKKYVSKEMSRKIHEKVAPLIQWLREAEVEDDDEDEAEEKDSEQEVEIKTKPAVNGNNNEKKGVNGKESIDEDEDDDMFEFSHRVSGIQIEEVKSVVAPKPVDVSEREEEAQAEDLDIDNI